MGDSKIWTYLLIAAVVVYFVNPGIFSGIFGSKTTTTTTTPTGTTTTTTPVTTTPSGCPSTGTGTLALNVRNELNATGSELYDNTVYVFASDGSLATTLSDTTNPSASTLNCGDTYNLKMAGSSSANSWFTGIDYGAASLNADGSITVPLNKAAISVGAKARQHGTLIFKMYDNNAAGWMLQAGGSSDWISTGATVNATTAATGLAVGAGGRIDETVNYEVNGTDTDFKDAYYIVALGVSLTQYNAPSVTIDGQVYSDVMSTLTSQEKTGLASFQYAYKVNAPILNSVHQMRVQVTPISGIDPTADITYNFYSAGNFLSVDGTTVGVGAFKDDSARTAVYTAQVITQAVD